LTSDRHTTRNRDKAAGTPPQRVSWMVTVPIKHLTACF
jgi:hypothetical protein